MRRFRLRALLCLVCAAVLALSCVSVSSAAAGNKKVTVMVYMCGSNLESDGAQGTGDIGKMIRSRFSKEDVNVVVLAGGSVYWSNGFDAGKLTLGVLDGSRNFPRTEYQLQAMGDPETLSFFLKLCAEEYPADQNVLVLWDHGGGPNSGVCMDDLFRGDTLSLQELSGALKNSPFANKGLDMIVFNACLMGSAELSVMMAPYADYLVAAEDSIYGLSYEWLGGAERRSALENAKMIVDFSYAFNSEIIDFNRATEINSFSVVDLNRATAVSDAAEAFFARVTPAMNAENFPQISAKRRNTVAFGVGESGGMHSFDLVDLGDLARQFRDLAPEEADSLLAAVQDAVVYHRSVLPECTGLTVYHPFENKDPSTIKYRIAVYNDLGFAPAYTSYVQNFTALLTGTRLASWQGLHLTASAQKDQRMLYTMGLTEEQAENLGAASLTAVVRDGDEGYRFMWTSSRYTLEDTVLTAEFVHNAVCLTDEDGNPLFTPLYYSVDAEGSYQIPATLVRFEKETEDGVLREVTHRGLVSCAYDADTRTLQPGSVQVWDEGLQAYTPAMNMGFTDYDEVLFTVTTRKETRDAEGVLLPFDEWETVKEEKFSAFTDEARLMLLPNLFETEDLYVAFNLTDSQNNHFLSDLLSARSGPQTVDAVTEYDDAGLVHIDALSVVVLGGKLNMNVQMTNLTDNEAVIEINNFTFNGGASGFSSYCFGSGENWGLLHGESAGVSCGFTREDTGDADVLTEITFDLNLINAADSTPLGTVPVKVALSVDLSGLQ